MRIAFIALAFVAVVIVCLELHLAEGKLHLKVPKVKLRSGVKVRGPKMRKARVRIPRTKHLGKTLGHAALGTTNVVSSLGTTGASIAETVLNSQKAQTDQAAD
ncbi:uncharacterized protein LOC142765105 [Rhipicephalus microplus]|uniref:uncharacterized protein LOC142765105 n=1 Tax=Rhipicephalus microplus TaxID=6941 RepID=UPI003F6B7A34